MTVPLPLYNRNQGNIQRARVNVDQSHVELAERQQQAANEVRQAERQYALTRAALDRIEGRLLPAAARVLDDARRLYEQGEEDAIVYLNAQREYNEAARQYRDMLVRHRRSMLRLNTGGRPAAPALNHSVAGHGVPARRLGRPLPRPRPGERGPARVEPRVDRRAARRASAACW